MTTFRASLSFSLLAASLLTAGCGGGDGYGERFPVSGRVTLDGEPLEEGRIVFIPLDATAGSPGASGAITGGQYDIPAEAGPSLGKYRVQIHRDRKTGKKIPDYDGEAGATKDEIVESIPAQYNTRSTLTAEVTGLGTFDFPLKSTAAGKERAG